LECLPFAQFLIFLYIFFYLGLTRRKRLDIILISDLGAGGLSAVRKQVRMLLKWLYTA
jgi:hypothetical protein